MKSILKKLIRDEKGAALVVALILLLVGGLISAALLGHMGTGLITGEIYETRTAELYAADAGVEDAVWKIQHGATPLCTAYRSWTYPSPYDPPIIVNGKSVQVTIEYQDDGTFKITSTAVTVDGTNTAAIVSSTGVEAYISPSFMDFSSLLDNAIVSYDTVTIQPGNTVDGDVWLPDKGDPDDWNKGDITGDIKDNNDVQLTWPTAEQLSSYYLDDLEGAADPGSSIDVKYTKTIGPCVRDGSLTVDNTGTPDTLVLEGTVYVRGNLAFEESGASKNYTIDLNHQTIFAEGGISFPSNVVSVSGPGCIIAIGNIDFQPSIAGDDFVLVMSIQGTVWFKPSGDFTGCIAGKVDVQLQPKCALDWVSPEGKGLDFPMGTGDDPNELPAIIGVRIESWEVSQQ